MFLCSYYFAPVFSSSYALSVFSFIFWFQCLLLEHSSIIAVGLCLKLVASEKTLCESNNIFLPCGRDSLFLNMTMTLLRQMRNYMYRFNSEADSHNNSAAPT